MTFAKKAPALALFIGLLAGLAAAEGTNTPLFVIERSKNANVVQYDARLTAAGTLDAKQPVIAYWILKAEDGRRESLNMVERMKAYGFDIKPDPAGKFWVMTLVADRKREITVRQTAGGVRAEMPIGGRPSILEKVYIDSTDGKLLPKVNFIEFSGTDQATGEKTREKIIPE